MNRTLLCALVLPSSLLPCRAAAQIAVAILDAPSSVYSFEPVYVTFEVRNKGDAPVVIPVDTCSDEGAFLEAGLRGARLIDRQLGADCVPQQLVRLLPGRRWLFFLHFALGPTGDFEIEAVLRSPGHCRGRPIGPEKHQIEQTRPIVWGERPYDCWLGEERSERISVSVRIPDSQVDLAAAESMQLEHLSSPKTLLPKLRELTQRFPTSHYTYAGLYHINAGSGLLGMLDVVLQQPDNPLNPRTTGAMARDFALRTRPCAGPRAEPPFTLSDRIVERFKTALATYPLPRPVAEYLRQLKGEVAAEECQARMGEETQPLP